MLDELLRFVPPALHQEYLGLLAHIPLAAPTVVVAGRSCAALGYLLKKRGHTTVVGATAHPHGAALAAEILDRILESPEAMDTLADGSCDAILLCNLEAERAAAADWLAALHPKLHAHGQVYALYGQAGAAGDHAEPLAASLTALLAGTGLHVYNHWQLPDPTAGGLLLAVAPGYNPILHARAMRDAGAFETGYDILEKIPEVYRADPGTQQAIRLEMLDCLAAWIARTAPGQCSHLLSRAQEQFYLLTNQAPALADAYTAMAECWIGAGDRAMARKLIRSIRAVQPGAAPGFPDEWPAETHPGHLAVEAPEAMDCTGVRVLFLMHPRPHFGLDALYDGLCAVLGDDNVVEFPWKATLHGQESEAHRNYPCRYDRRGVPRRADEIVAGLQAGAFDFVLYGDVEGDIPAADVQAIVDACGRTPIFLVDALDSLCDFRQLAAQRLGRPDFPIYFKRELLRCIDYGSPTYPLPFSYAAPDVPVPEYADRHHDFFWAGHRMFGQRRLYLGALEQRYGWDLSEQFDQAAYRQRLLDSRIGLNCFGMGFDTVRYWELPAHGCLLLSDRLPIAIPHDFQDGAHAVFFDDLADLVEKLDYLLAHPRAAAAIAHAGRQHYLAHHTTAARARQLLGWIRATLAG